MSEIEKMYKNANIKKRWNSTPYGGIEEYYPPFTAEKQLLLIQWLAETRPIHINKLIDGWIIEGIVRNNKQYANFENAISGYINSIYPFLNEHQRAEIKEILK